MINRRWRIALMLATPGSTWGGMEKHTLELARGLAERGHEIHVLADAGYRERFLGTARFHPIPVHFSRRHPWLSLRLRRLLRRIRPDICHAQGNKAAQMLGNLKRRGDSTEITYVGTLHGTKSSPHAFSKLDGVIAVSDELAASLPNQRKQIIYNGISWPPSSLKTDFPIPTERPLVLAAGRLEPVKRFDRLIEAWEKQPKESGQLVILGDGSERERLQTMIEKADLKEQVQMPGYESNVAGWLAQADACVISSDREGFPYILVEALLSGCPVVSTPVSGVSRFLPGESIAASTSSDDLAALLETTLADLPHLERQQQMSFEKAARTLSASAMVDQTLMFYGALRPSDNDVTR